MLESGTAISPMWFSIPLIVVISLVYAATRHERMGPILGHAARFAAWIVGFMAVVLLIFMLISWLV
jgi:fumarate reductase subunit C